ncbi:MAG: ABC transporter ATP-binding protein, partial [Gammaproteobacteria bacterium]
MTVEQQKSYANSTQAIPDIRLKFSVLVQYVTPYKRILLLALLLMVSESAISLVTPWLAGRFTEGILGGGYPWGLSVHGLLLLWLVVLAVQALLRFGNQYLLGSASEQMLAQLRMRLYDHLQALPLSFYHERKRGEVLTLLTNDAASLSSFVTGTLLSLLPLFITLIGALVLIFMISPLIAFLAAALVPLFYLVMKILGRRIRPISSAMVNEYGKTFSFSIVEENLNLLPVIKSFTREAAESARFQQGNLRLLELTRQYLRIQAVLSPVIQFLAAAGIVLLLWVGTGYVQSEQLTAGELVSLLLYGMLLTRPVSGLADVYGQVQLARGSAERLLDVFSI